MSWITTCKRTKLNSYLTFYTITNPEWIKDLNVRFKTKVLRKKYRGKLHGIGFGNDFSDVTLQSQATEAK